MLSPLLPCGPTHGLHSGRGYRLDRLPRPLCDFWPVLLIDMIPLVARRSWTGRA